MDPRPAETVAKAVVKESIPANPNPVTKEGIAQGLATKLEENNWRAGLEIEAGGTVDRAQVTARVEDLGTTRDATGKKTRPGDEGVRYNEASKFAQLELKFSDVGYDKLTPTEKNEVLLGAAHAIQKSPELNKQYMALATAADRRAFLERVIKSPQFSTELKNVLGEIASEEALTDSVSDAQEAVTSKTQERAIIDSELNELNRQLGTIDRQLQGFDGTSVPPGTEYTTLQNLRTALPTTKAALAKAQGSAELVSDRLTTLRTERTNIYRTGSRPVADIDADITRAEGEYRTAKQKEAAAQAQIDQITELEARETRLRSDRQEISNQTNTKQRELATADQELATSRKNYEDAKALRTSIEQSRVNKFKGVFEEATARTINAQVEEMAARFDAALEDARNKETDKRKKGALATLQGKLKTSKPQKRWGKTENVRKINKAGTNELFTSLMTNGPEEGIRGLLAETINPDTGVQYVPIEITALMNDKAFVDSMKPEFAKQVLAHKMLIGGVSESDITLIGDSDWGQGMIQAAIGQSEAAKAEVEAVMGKGAVDKPGFTKRFLREAGTKKNAGLIAILVGIPYVMYQAIQSGKIAA